MGGADDKGSDSDVNDSRAVSQTHFWLRIYSGWSCYIYIIYQISFDICQIAIFMSLGTKIPWDTNEAVPHLPGDVAARELSLHGEIGRSRSERKVLYRFSGSCRIIVGSCRYIIRYINRSLIIVDLIAIRCHK